MPAVFESLRNPDGSLNRTAIYGLPVSELKAWINQRLSGDDPYLPLGRSEELPHTLLLQLFEATDLTHPFRKRLHQATRELLEPVLTGKTAPPSPVWLGELMRLVFATRGQVSRGILRKAFETESFSTEGYLEAGTDIEILDLLAIQEGLEPIGFWNKLLEHSRYSLSAFAALERYGPQAVILGLPIFIAALRSTPELGRPESRLALPLKRVFERFGIDRLLPLLETRLAHPDRVVVEGALDLVGIPLAQVGMLRLWPAVPLLTPDEVYKRLSEAALKYSSWLRANVQFRVLDMTTNSMAGLWCRSLLAEYGAEVVVAESRAGDPVRRLIFEDKVAMVMNGERAAKEARNTFFITLDLAMPEGREILMRLAAQADVLIENYPHGQFDAWGIGYRQLSQVNTRLVYGWIGHSEQWKALEQRHLWISDYVRGTLLAIEIITALEHREQVSHRGAFVDAMAAFGIMRIIDYESPPFQLTQEAPSRRPRWDWRPTGSDNWEVYRRIFSIQEDYLDRLKDQGII